MIMDDELKKCLAGEWYDCHAPVFIEFKQMYLWSISGLSDSLAVYWTAEYLYVILLGLQSLIWLKCRFRKNPSADC